MNNGQACVAQTRILVGERRHDEVVDALADMMSGLRVGDPADEATDIGPLVAQRQQARVQDYIRSGVEEGARMVLGGEDAPHSRGWYVQPTLFADVTQRHAHRPRRDLRSGAERARHTATKPTRSESPTTATTVWPDRCGPPTSRTAWRSPPSVRAGTYGINMYTLDIGSPFGGFKQSGIGREFGPEGLHEYVELQSVISKGAMPPLPG